MIGPYVFAALLSYVLLNYMIFIQELMKFPSSCRTDQKTLPITFLAVNAKNFELNCDNFDCIPFFKDPKAPVRSFRHLMLKILKKSEILNWGLLEILVINTFVFGTECKWKISPQYKTPM